MFSGGGGGGVPERNIEFGDVSSKLNNDRTCRGGNKATVFSQNIQTANSSPHLF